jgi:glycosyltransferase involved in cell wall biosynthesis
VDQPFVSIGMPVYNAERYLSQALESLLAQDHSHFEIVISDNNSLDRTQEICHEFAARDQRIRYVRQPLNQGMPWNFAYVVREARGEYFTWAAHDDLFHPTFIRKCLELLAAHPGAICCCTEINFIDADGLPHPDWSKKQYSNIETLGMTPPQRIHELLNRDGWFASYGLMRLRDAKKMSLELRMYGYDVIQLEELLLLGDFVKVHEPLFRYRMTGPKSPTHYQAALNSETTSIAPTKTPYTNLATDLLQTVYRSHLTNEQKTEIFADFLLTISRSAKWWREEIISELDGQDRNLSEPEFVMLFALVLTRSLPTDEIKDNPLIKSICDLEKRGPSLVQVAEDLCIEAGIPVPTLAAYREALRLCAEGKLEEASEQFGRALRQRETSEIWCDWATVRLLCNEVMDAEMGLRQALRIDHYNTLANLKLGVLLARLDRNDEAILYLERCASGKTGEQLADVLRMLESCRSKVAAAAGT